MRVPRQQGFQQPEAAIRARWFREQDAFESRLAAVLETLPDARISSWWRSVAENRRVKGNVVSQHLIGAAADLDWPGGWGSLSADERGAIVQVVRSLGLVPDDEPDHLHVQLFARAKNPLRRVPLLV